MVPNRPFHRPTVSRRQLLITTGTFVAGGGVVAATGSQPAKGSVNTTALQIPPAEHTGEDGSVADLQLEVVGGWEYQVADADTLTLALDVAPETGDNPNFHTIDQSEQSLGATSGAGQYTLAGSILDHAGMDAQMFSAKAGETVSHELPVRVVMDVLLDGESVVTAMAQTVAAVTVENTSISAQAAVMGEGEVAIEV